MAVSFLTFPPQNLPRSIPLHRPPSLHLLHVHSSSKLDSLCIYSPPSSHRDNFISCKFLSSSPTRKSGSDSISFPLVNLRSNYSFRIFGWTESEVDPNHLDQDHNPLPGIAYVAATSVDELTFETGRGSDQIHLSFIVAYDEMRVMFVTSNSGERTVRYDYPVNDVNAKQRHDFSVVCVVEILRDEDTVRGTPDQKWVSFGKMA